MSGGARSWAVGGASVRGAAHVRRGTVNQDALLWRPPAGGARHFIAAVADGHGAAAHHHSDIGAQLAVQSACSVLEWFLDGDTSEAAAQGLAGEVLTAWQNAVQSHAATLAPAGDWVEPSSDKLLPYGATLLAVAATEALTVALQIGDGDIYFGMPDGRVIRPLPDDRGLVGEQTYSLCAPDALLRFRLAVLRAGHDGTLPDFVLLATDGVAKSFADERAFHGVVEHYRRVMMSSDPPSVFAPLPAWLEAVSQRGSGDDATLCLAASRII